MPINNFKNPSENDIFQFKNGQWVLVNGTGSGSIGPQPSNFIGNNISASDGTSGVSPLYSRADHTHKVITNTAVSVGSTNSQGVAITLSRSDHTHKVTDLNITGQATGDMLYFDGVNWVKKTIGTSGQILLSNGSTPNWFTANSSIINNLSSVAGSTVTSALNNLLSSIVTLPSAGITGQALIWNGSNWISGGSTNINNNYFGSQNLINDGYIYSTNYTLKNNGSYSIRNVLNTTDLLALSAPLDIITLGNGFQSTNINSNGLTGTGVTLQSVGTALFYAISGKVANVTDLFAFDISGGFSDKTIRVDNTPPAALAATLQKLTIQSQGGIGLTGPVKSGQLVLASGDITGSGILTGANTLIRGGHGTINGNISFGADIANSQGMQDGIFLGNCSALPSGNPIGGLFHFSSSGNPSWRNSNGNTTTLDGYVSASATGGALTPPVLVSKYMSIILGGTSYKVALYNP